MMLGLGVNLMLKNGGGAAAWTPASIAGLRIWQDAAQIAGLNDGDAVSSWSDSSGNGLALTQATGTKQPLYKTGIFGSQPAVLFDGVDDELVIASHSFSLTAGTIFAVYRATAGSYAVVRVNNDLDGTYWRFAGDGNGYWPLFRVTRLAAYPAAMPGSGVGAYVVDVSTATQKEVWVNGVSKGTQASTFQSPDRVEMGGPQTGPGGPPMTGYVAEWGMYDSALSGTNLTALQNYLAAKYGLAFTPASIPGLKVWLDVTDAANVTVATGASQINDLSGNGNHATQATASNQPAYTSGSHITCDGVDDWMEIPALGAINSSGRSYVFKIKFSTSQLGGVLTMRGAGGSKQFSAYVSNASASGNGLRRIGFTTGTLLTNQTVVQGSDSDTNWHTAVLTRVNTSMKLYLDGVLVATNSNNVGDVDIDFKTFLGTYADGNTPGGGLFFNGDVQKVLIYTSELSLTDVQTLYANGY